MADTNRNVAIKVSLANGNMKLGPADVTSIMHAIKQVQAEAAKIKIQPFSDSAIEQLKQVKRDIGGITGSSATALLSRDHSSIFGIDLEQTGGATSSDVPDWMYGYLRGGKGRRDPRAPKPSDAFKLTADERAMTHSAGKIQRERANASAQEQKEADDEYNRIAREGVASWSKIMADRKQHEQKVIDDRKQFIQGMKGLAMSGASASGSHEMVHGIAMIEGAYQSLSSIAGSMGSTLSAPFVLAGAAVAALAAGVLVTATALREAKESNSRYWESMAVDAERSAQRQLSAANKKASMSAHEIMGRRDIAGITGVPGRIGREQARESQIRAEQDAIADRPLAERQEIRRRIEQRGAGEERMEALRLSGTDLASKREALKKERTGKEREIRNIDATREQARLQRERSIKEQGPTAGGRVLEGASSLASRLLFAGVVNPFQGATDSVAGAFGQVTERQGRLNKLEQQKVGKAAEEKENQQRATLEGQIYEIKQQEADLANQETQHKIEQLGISREMVKQAREAAEIGRENLKGTHMAFGMATKGEQAQLKRIQAKSDAGGVLTHHERGLARRFNIDAAEKVGVVAAREGAESGLFKKQEQLQAGREDRAQKAEAAPVLKEQDKFEKEISDAAQRAADVKNELIASFKPLVELVDVVTQTQRELDELKRRIDNETFNQSRWF